MSLDQNNRPNPPATLEEPHVLHDEHRPGPAPIGTLVVVGLLILATIWLWMLVLGIQQGRA